MDETPPLSRNTPLRLVVDPSLPPDEVRVHPAAFQRIQQAFLDADAMWGFPHVNRLMGDNL